MMKQQARLTKRSRPRHPLSRQSLFDSFFEKLDIPLNFREITDKLWITEGEQQDIYEIENLGMQLWVNELRQIETIICALY